MVDLLLNGFGGTLLAVVLWDAFITIFSLGGAGPLTRRWTSGVWRILLRLHHRRPIHGLLALAGPALLVGILLVWYAGLLLSFFLLFWAQAPTVMDSQSKTPAGALEVLYFVSNTTSTVGYGDFLPQGLPWTFLAGTSAMITTVIITVSLSFVISVLTAAIDRRHLAQNIFSTGVEVPELIRLAHFRNGESPLMPHYISIASQIDRLAQSHVAFPILYFFHNKRPEQSPTRALLLLSDSFFIMSLMPAEERSPEGLTVMLDNAVDAYLEHSSLGLRPSDGSAARARRLYDLVHESIPEESLPPDHESRLQDYVQRRKRLEALCAEDGWLPAPPGQEEQEETDPQEG